MAIPHYQEHIHSYDLKALTIRFVADLAPEASEGLILANEVLAATAADSHRARIFHRSESSKLSMSFVDIWSTAAVEGALAPLYSEVPSDGARVRRTLAINLPPGLLVMTTSGLRAVCALDIEADLFIEVRTTVPTLKRAGDYTMVRPDGKYEPVSRAVQYAVNSFGGPMTLTLQRQHESAAIHAAIELRRAAGARETVKTGREKTSRARR